MSLPLLIPNQTKPQNNTKQQEKNTIQKPNWQRKHTNGEGSTKNNKSEEEKNTVTFMHMHTEYTLHNVLLVAYFILIF